LKKVLLKTAQEQQLQTSLAADPGNSKLIKALGDIYLARNDFARATEKYQLATKNTPRQILPDILIQFETKLKENYQNTQLRFYFVKFLLASGEIQEAAEELEEIIALEPTNKTAILRLFHIYHQNKKVRLAVKTLEQGRQQLKDDVTITEMLANTYLQQKRLAEAILLYEEILAQNPQNIKISKILAELYKQNQQPEKAANLYRNIAKYDSGCYEEASQFLQDLLATYPRKPELYRVQGAIFLSWFKPDQAIIIYQKMLRLFPALLEEIIGKYRQVLDVYPDYPAANFALAEANILRKYYSEAVLIYNQLLKSNPDFIQEVMTGLQRIIQRCPEQVLAHQALAECLLQQKKLSAAIKELRCLLKFSQAEADVVLAKTYQIINENNALVEAYLLLAECFFVKEDWKRVRTELSKVFNLVKDYGPGLVLLARVDFIEQRFSPALQNFRQALATTTREIDLCNEFKNMYTITLEAKIQTLGQTYKKSSKTDCLWQLAQSHYQLNQLDLAVEYFQQLLTKPQYTALSYYYLGKCFKGQGNFELALRQFQKGLQGATGQEQKKFLLEAGFCGEALGELNRAAEIYQSIIEENGPDRQAKMRLQRLNSNNWVDLKGKTLLGVDNQPHLLVLWYKNPEVTLAKLGERDLLEISFAQSHNNQGVEYVQKNRLKAAEDEFVLALQLDKNFTVSHNNLGVVNLKLGKIVAAKENFKKVLALNPRFYVAQYNYALACYLAGEQEEAQQEFRKALAADPDLAAVAINFGDVLYASGQIESALTVWQQVAQNSFLYELGEQRLQFIGIRERTGMGW
jgi:tetratricopeptide (TPR) repeat protein